MSFEIDNIVTVRQKPWHIGTCVEEAMTSAQAVELAGANFNIVQTPVYDQRGLVIPGYQANVRDDTGEALAIVGSRYSVVQNAQSAETLDYLIGEGLEFEVAGCAKNYTVFWIVARMPQRAIVGDAYTPYIVLINTHDGSGAVTICITPNRMVCNNQLNFITKTAKRKWSMIHKGSVSDKIGAARQTLGLMDAYLNNLEAMADYWANEPFYEPDVQKALDMMLALPENASDRQKRTNEQIREEIIQCTFAPDLHDFLDTKWGFLQAVADYADHSNPIRETKNWRENRLLSVVNGHPLIDKAVEAVWRI